MFPNPQDVSDDRELLIAHVIEGLRLIEHALGRPSDDQPTFSFPAHRHIEFANTSFWREYDESKKSLVSRLRVVPEGILRSHGLTGQTLRLKTYYIYSVWTEFEINFRNETVQMPSPGQVVTIVVKSAIDAAGAGTALKEVGDIAADVIGSTPML